MEYTCEEGKVMANNRRRRQQVRRQLVILGGFVVLIAATVIGFSTQRSKKDEALAAAKIEEKEEQKDEQKTEHKNTEPEEETAAERLARVKKQASAAGYPKGVIELLSKNEETVQFVEEYEKKKDAPYADNIGAGFVKGQIPPLLQWDERWGYAPYGTSIIAVSGCGPTCLSMVVSGLTGDWSVTPAKVAAYGTENGYVDEENNTYWRFMEEAPANWNVSVKELPLVEQQIAAELQAGHPVICSVGPGDFTDNGHFIVLTGYNNGEVTINDPFSRKNSSRTWKFSEIQDQIAAMWVYSL